MSVVTCTMCGRVETERTILDHIADAHGIEINVQRWPDGAPVVVDMAISPEDFTEGERS